MSIASPSQNICAKGTLSLPGMAGLAWLNWSQEWVSGTSFGGFTLGFPLATPWPAIEPGVNFWVEQAINPWWIMTFTFPVGAVASLDFALWMSSGGAMANTFKWAGGKFYS
jgi:hypothetical protein